MVYAQEVVEWENTERELNILNKYLVEVKYRFKRSTQIIGYTVSQSEHTHVPTTQVKRSIRFLKAHPLCAPITTPALFILSYQRVGLLFSILFKWNLFGFFTRHLSMILQFMAGSFFHCVVLYHMTVPQSSVCLVYLMDS